MMPLTTNYFFGVKIVLLMHAPLHFQFITFNLVGNLLSTKLVIEGVDRSVKEKIANCSFLVGSKFRVSVLGH